MNNPSTSIQQQQTQQQQQARQPQPQPQQQQQYRQFQPPNFQQQHIAQLHQAQQQQLHAQQGPQQQQQQQQQQPQHAMNGMNGGQMPPGGGAGGGGGAMGMTIPTPAGHQAELNYIYGMVEDLSRQLADNRRTTEEIVNGLGRVRSRARADGTSNDGIINGAAEEINGQTENLDALISLLSESLEKAKHSRDANASLLSQYANVLAALLKQFHEYKARHVADVTAWHSSYRAQLDDERRENAKLREQIWEMQAHASRANESLRHFRRKYDEDEKRWNGRVESVSARQELRFWKRMAMPELEDDDTYWSGDDDIIDPAEKERLRELEQRAQHEQLMADAQADDGDGSGQSQQGPFQNMGVMGGIAMQREDTSQINLPQLPPRPMSAASSTGSTGES